MRIRQTRQSTNVGMDFEPHDLSIPAGGEEGPYYRVNSWRQMVDGRMVYAAWPPGPFLPPDHPNNPMTRLARSLLNYPAMEEDLARNYCDQCGEVMGGMVEYEGQWYPIPGCCSPGIPCRRVSKWERDTTEAPYLGKGYTEEQIEFLGANDRHSLKADEFKAQKEFEKALRSGSYDFVTRPKRSDIVEEAERMRRSQRDVRERRENFTSSTQIRPGSRHEGIEGLMKSSDWAYQRPGSGDRKAGKNRWVRRILRPPRVPYTDLTETRNTVAYVPPPPRRPFAGIPNPALFPDPEGPFARSGARSRRA